MVKLVVFFIFLINKYIIVIEIKKICIVLKEKSLEVLLINFVFCFINCLYKYINKINGNEIVINLVGFNWFKYRNCYFK